MKFKDFFMAMPPPEREGVATRANTTVAYLLRVAYGKPISLGLADALEAVSKGSCVVTGGDFTLADDARRHLALRESYRNATTAASAK